MFWFHTTIMLIFENMKQMLWLGDHFKIILMYSELPPLVAHCKSYNNFTFWYLQMTWLWKAFSLREHLTGVIHITQREHFHTQTGVKIQSHFQSDSQYVWNPTIYHLTFVISRTLQHYHWLNDMYWVCIILCRRIYCFFIYIDI